MKTLPQVISQQDWDSNRQYIQLSTGIKMAYVEMGNPDGPTVIMQHGMTDNSRVWSLSAPIFCEAGYHLYMTELRGHGYTDKPDGFYTIIDYAKDINAFMDAKGIDKAIMIGHSLGSMTMQAFLMMFPEKCDKVILLASAYLDSATHKPDTYDLVRTSMSKNGRVSDEFIETWYANENPVPADFLSLIKQEAVQLPGKSWINIFGGTCVITLNDMYPLFDKNVPLLLMFGNKDAIIPLHRSDMLREALPHAEYIEYDGIGHNIQYEIPERFAEDALQFLNTNKQKD